MDEMKSATILELAAKVPVRDKTPVFQSVVV
jgi:hypothetical protein